MANELMHLFPSAHLGAEVQVAAFGASAMLNSYTHYSSGRAVGFCFTSLEDQTSSTLSVWAWFNAKNGSPTTMRCAIYRGAEPGDATGKPKNEASLASTTVDISSIATHTLHRFDLTVSLTKGKTYWIVISNESPVPGTDYPTYTVKVPLTTSYDQISALSTTDGWVSNPNWQGNVACVVLKYASGTMQGSPYIVAGPAPSSNTNLRGNRYLLPHAVRIRGVSLGQFSTALSDVKVIVGTTEVYSKTIEKNNIGGHPITFPDPVEIAANTVFYVVVSFSSSSNIFTRFYAGLTPPTDITNLYSPMIKSVNASTIGGLEASAVDGIAPLKINLMDLPSASSGGGETSHTFQL